MQTQQIALRQEIVLESPPPPGGGYCTGPIARGGGKILLLSKQKRIITVIPPCRDLYGTGDKKKYYCCHLLAINWVVYMWVPHSRAQYYMQWCDSGYWQLVV